jgi:hypothetical protein
MHQLLKQKEKQSKPCKHSITVKGEVIYLDLAYQVASSNLQLNDSILSLYSKCRAMLPI